MFKPKGLMPEHIRGNVCRIVPAGAVSGSCNGTACWTARIFTSGHVNPASAFDTMSLALKTQAQTESTAGNHRPPLSKIGSGYWTQMAKVLARCSSRSSFSFPLSFCPL